MRQQVGFLMQLVVLTLLPFLIVWQLSYELPLIRMPVLTLAGIALFTLGTRLRNGKA
ncbi:MAG: hypothetical protein VB861_11825 [Planctomycetaceae bacterium]|jgi:heme/copper-type cytochrome/quinol oxidase subunit 4